MTYLKENYKSILAYTGIFFVLLMGSGLVKIPVGSAWFYVIKFGIIAFVLGLGIYFFHRQLITDYLKLSLFVPFTIDFHLHYAFIFLTIILFNKKLLLPWNSPLKPIYLLFIWGFISYIINQFIEYNPFSFPLFVITFFLPFILFSLFYTQVNENKWIDLINYYLNIIAIMLMIIGAQIIVLWNEHPDLRDGGTNHAHTAGVYLCIGILLIFYKYFRTRNFSKSDFTIIVLSICAMFFMDVKYILFFLCISLTPIVYLLMKENKKIRYGLIIGIPTILIFWVFILDGRIYHSVLSLKDQNYKVTDLAKNYPNSEKGRLFTNYIKMITERPIYAMIGTGPGTFLSRASYFNSPEYVVRWKKDYKGWFFGPMNALRFSNNKIDSWCRINYGESGKYFAIEPVNTTFYDWRSSLINILFEVGIVGLVLLVLFITGRRDFKVVARDYTIVLPFIIFFLLMMILDLWYEYPHYRFLQDSFLGIIFIKKSVVQT
jgi:hypothetical protein